MKRKNFEVTGNTVLCSRLFKPTIITPRLRKKNLQHRITLSVVLSLRSTKYFGIPSRKRVVQGFPDERRRVANVRQVDAVRRKQEPNPEESEAEHKLRMALAAEKQLSEELSFPSSS